MCYALPIHCHRHKFAVRIKATNRHKRVRSLEQPKLAPIHRLPVEMLAEIFLSSIYCHDRSPSSLMTVCRYWRAVILAIPNIWANVRLSTWTEIDKVRSHLQRTKESLLNVEIDTIADDHKVVRGTRKFLGLAVAAEEAKRWRNLLITSFPSKVDVDAYLTSEIPAFTFDGPMDALESFRITNPCENNVLFDQLLDIIGSSSHSNLVDMEIMSQNALYRLSQPHFATIFRHLITFKVGVRDMRLADDILPYFERLETLDVSGLHLPSYPADRDLPVVRTLKCIKLKAASIEWMMGREFPMVLECAITSPQQVDAFHHGLSLPVCTNFTYKGRKPYLLSYANLPQLTSLEVGNSVWNSRRGSEELMAPPIGSFARQWTELKTLHLDTPCHSETIIVILSLLPALEELNLGISRPNALGRKFFAALLAGKSESSDGTSWSVFLCPNLRTLGLRYRRWIRESETDRITSILPGIVDSRKRTSTPLRSLHIWTSVDDVEGTEMCDVSGGEMAGVFEHDGIP